MNTDKKALVLFSGGKDSFLAACNLITAGYQVTLLSTNNGCLAMTDAFEHGARRIENRYGKSVVKIAGTLPIAGIIATLNSNLSNVTWAEMAAKYPNMTNAQLDCLYCQTAMWIAAIAYAKTFQIPVIATGYRNSDPFCTGLPNYMNRIREVAEKHGITVQFPVLCADWKTPEDRNREMKRFGFVPKVYEAHCFIGRNVNPMTIAQKEQVIQYFDEQIAHRLASEIEQTAAVWKTVPPRKESISDIRFSLPDGTYTGLY